VVETLMPGTISAIQVRAVGGSSPAGGRIQPRHPAAWRSFTRPAARAGNSQPVLPGTATVNAVRKDRNEETGLVF